MNTHDDFAHTSSKKRLFLRELEERAKKMVDNRASAITGGSPGEPVVDNWTENGIMVTKRPDDEQGIMRISIGGGPNTPVNIDYCVFRGDLGDAVDLLERALVALKSKA